MLQLAGTGRHRAGSIHAERQEQETCKQETCGSFLRKHLFEILDVFQVISLDSLSEISDNWQQCDQYKIFSKFLGVPL